MGDWGRNHGPVLLTHRLIDPYDPVSGMIIQVLLIFSLIALGRVCDLPW